MSSLCSSKFHFFSLVCTVSYVTGCQKISPSAQSASISQKMRLEIFFKIGFSLKSNDFDFEIVNFPFLDGDVPRSPSYGVYISQLIRFARVCSNIDDFNNRTLFLTA